MKLTDLDAGFLEHPTRGLMLVMRCPLCQKHHVGVPVTAGIKQPNRWKVDSKDLTTLTLEPSILAAWPKETPAQDRCPYHFKIEKGEIVNC